MKYIVDRTKIKSGFYDSCTQLGSLWRSIDPLIALLLAVNCTMKYVTHANRIGNHS